MLLMNDREKIMYLLINQVPSDRCKWTKNISCKIASYVEYTFIYVDVLFMFYVIYVLAFIIAFYDTAVK